MLANKEFRYDGTHIPRQMTLLSKIFLDCDPIKSSF